MSNSKDTEQKDRNAIRYLKQIPKYPCARCDRWIDEYGDPICRNFCGKYNDWFAWYWHELREKYKEKK